MYLRAISNLRFHLVSMSLVFQVLNANLAGKGKPLIALWVFVVALLVNISLNILLVPSKGVIGAALASTVSYCTGEY